MYYVHEARANCGPCFSSAGSSSHLGPIIWAANVQRTEIRAAGGSGNARLEQFTLSVYLCLSNCYELHESAQINCFVTMGNVETNCAAVQLGSHQQAILYFCFLFACETNFALIMPEENHSAGDRIRSSHPPIDRIHVYADLPPLEPLGSGPVLEPRIDDLLVSVMPLRVLSAH